MADNTTGLPVQTLTGQFVETKLVDSGGTNVASVSAGGALSVDASGATVPVSDAAGSLTVDAPVGTPVFVELSDGSSALIGQATKAASLPVTLASDEDALNVITELPSAAALADNTSNPTVPGVGSFLMGFDGTNWDRVQLNASGQLEVEVVAGGSSGTEYTHDAAAGTADGGMGMAQASAAAPTDVTADGDAVALWALRNGSQVMNLASGGTLVTLGQKTAANSLPVTLPSDEGIVSNPFGVQISDGSAALIGQKAKAGSLPVTLASDEDTLAISATNLQVDVNQIIGSAPAATNPLPVRLTDGSGFYAAASSAPTDPQFSTQTSAALGAGSNTTLTHYVTSGKTGQLQGVDAGATVPCKVVINTVVTGTPTSRVILFTKPYEVYQWRAPFKTYITQASSDATTGFSVTITNKDTSVAADVYSTAYWDEV